MPENEEHSGEHEEATRTALPHAVHIGVPIASILVLLLVALTISLPANKGAFPVQSTEFFVPVYIAILLTFVFSSIYVFKKFMESDVEFKEH